MGTWLFSCSGAYGVTHQHDERISAPSNPCWNHLVTHTYHFGSTFSVSRIQGTLVFGPSEGKWVTIQCQLSTNGTSWSTVGSSTQYASTTGRAFDFSISSTNAAHMRFISITSGGYVDGSSGTVTYTDQYRKIVNLIPSIYGDKIKLDWGYSSGQDFNRIQLYCSTPTSTSWGFLKTFYVNDPTTHTDYIHYGTQFPYETVYYMFISYKDSTNEIERVNTSIIYPPPKNIINLQITQKSENVILEWEHGEGTTAYTDEIYIKEGDNLILLGTLSSDIETFTDSTRTDSGIYSYYLRSMGELTFWSQFTIGSIDYLKTEPQIELGVGGEALRHAIYTYHNESEADRNSMTFKIWDSSIKNILEEPNSSDPDVILQGDEKVFTKNINPFLNDTYDLGSEESKWRKTNSVNIYSDSTKTAKLKLWNGK